MFTLTNELEEFLKGIAFRPDYFIKIEKILVKHHVLDLEQLKSTIHDLPIEDNSREIITTALNRRNNLSSEDIFNDSINETLREAAQG